MGGEEVGSAGAGAFVKSSLGPGLSKMGKTLTLPNVKDFKDLKFPILAS